MFHGSFPPEIAWLVRFRSGQNLGQKRKMTTREMKRPPWIFPQFCIAPAPRVGKNSAMTSGAKRLWISAALAAGVTALVLALQGQGFDPLLKAELDAQDFLMRQGRKPPVDPRLVFLGITKTSYADDLSEDEMEADPVLKMLGGSFPWSRAVWAATIERLAQAGAKVIVIDLLFGAPGPGDDVLRRTLEKHQDRVVIGANFVGLQNDFSQFLQKSQTLLLPTSTVLPAPATGHVMQDRRVGFVNLWSDFDEVIRRANFRDSGDRPGSVLPPGVTAESLAARALRQFGRADAIPPGDEPRRFRYTRAPGFGYKPVPLHEIFLPGMWTNNFQGGEFFRGKIVVIGPAANIFQDRHATPFQYPTPQMLGPEIHLNIIGAALQGEFLREISGRGQLGLIAAAGLLAWVLAFSLRQTLRRLVLVLLLAACYWVLGLLLFNHSRLLLPAVGPLLVLLAISLLIFGLDFAVERLEKMRVRRLLERYISRDVARELLDNPATFLNSLTGVRRPVAILFSDVRNFTTMTEGADAAQLVQQLNEYFEAMVETVFASRGSLDKFIGDAVMAVWGNIVSRGPAGDAEDAVTAALAMRRSLVKLNAGWKKRGLPELAFGIGVNHGEVIVGNLGCEEKMEVSVIGDAVNLASRLEGQTKEYHLELLLGESMAPLVREKFLLRTVDWIRVKGKTKPVDTFTVLGQRHPGEAEPGWLARHEEGVRCYRGRQFAAAAASFQEVLQAQPDDSLGKIYLERCAELAASPPGPDWDGVTVKTKK